MLAECSPAHDSPPTINLTATAQVAALQIGTTDLCAVVDEYWNHDWAVVIEALNRLAAQAIDCDPLQPTAGKLYAAHFNYGAMLHDQGQIQAAIVEYTTALNIKPDGREARQQLRILKAPLPAPPPLPICDDTLIADAQLPPYQPSIAQNFVQILGQGFTLDSEPFTMQGVNYFPAETPWRRFLTETEQATVQRDFTLFEETGFNTLRIFLWHEALFQCEGQGAIPQPATFEFLDALIHLAAEHHLRLIVTLNDLADLDLYHLYDDFSYTQAQIKFIVDRYQYEPAIVAWDVRNEPDIDYDRYHADQASVLNWLLATIERIRVIDQKHLITIGWLHDANLLVDEVDFVSFHHWSGTSDFTREVRRLKKNHQKPLIVEEVGYSTYRNTPEQQAAALGEIIRLGRERNLAGWLVWTAFDYPTSATCVPPACPSKDNLEHHFGIWHADDTPKVAVEVLKSYLLTD